MIFDNTRNSVWKQQPLTHCFTEKHDYQPPKFFANLAGYTCNMGGSTIGTPVAMSNTGITPARLTLGTFGLSPASIVGGTKTLATKTSQPRPFPRRRKSPSRRPTAARLRAQS